MLLSWRDWHAKGGNSNPIVSTDEDSESRYKEHCHKILALQQR